MAQLVEHVLGKDEVVGSSPIISSISCRRGCTRADKSFLGVAQFGSALEWGSRGRKFKSSHSDQRFSKNTGRRTLCFLLLFCFGERENFLSEVTRLRTLSFKKRKTSSYVRTIAIPSLRSLATADCVLAGSNAITCCYKSSTQM